MRQDEKTDLAKARHETCWKADRPTEAETTNNVRLIVARTLAKPEKSGEELFSFRDFQIESADAATAAGDRSDLRMAGAFRDDPGSFFSRRGDAEDRWSPTALADALKSALLQIFRYLVDVALSNEPPLRGCEPFPRKQSVSPKGFGEAYEISVLKSRNHRFLQ